MIFKYPNKVREDVMKKGLVVILVAFLAFGNVRLHAANPRFYGGVGLGIVKTDITTGGSTEYRQDFLHRPSFFLGSEFPIQSEGKISLVFETSYREMGSKLTDSLTISDFKNSYFCLNPGIKYRFINKFTKFFVKSNVNFGILTSAEVGGRDVKNHLASQDYGIDLSAGFEMPITQVANLYYEIRYSMGIKNIDDDEFLFESASNNGILLTLGFIL
jgi:hypothetical protein